jgi:phosphoribosylanthranilate isomerase
MNNVKIKICGITSIEALYAATDAGANAVGFVVDVSTSPRNLSIQRASNLIKNTPIFVDTVLVTVTNNIRKIQILDQELSPRRIQVYGSPTFFKNIRKKMSNASLIGSVRVDTFNIIKNAIDTAKFCDAVLLDSYIADKHGGTGIIHDWNVSKQVKEAIYPKPLILAGGLNPSNVKEAINRVKPYAVDVSSGVESSPGLKDPNKIFEFIKNAKEICCE